MVCKISDLRDKQVICVCNGIALGPVCDVEFDTSCGKLISIVVFGRCRCMGLFGREEDIIIPWNEIKVIGPDTILVGINPPQNSRRNGLFSRFSGR